MIENGNVFDELVSSGARLLARSDHQRAVRGRRAVPAEHVAGRAEAGLNVLRRRLRVTPTPGARTRFCYGGRNSRSVHGSRRIARQRIARPTRRYVDERQVARSPAGSKSGLEDVSAALQGLRSRTLPRAIRRTDADRDLLRPDAPAGHLASQLRQVLQPDRRIARARRCRRAADRARRCRPSRARR